MLYKFFPPIFIPFFCFVWGLIRFILTTGCFCFCTWFSFSSGLRKWYQFDLSFLTCAVFTFFLFYICLNIRWWCWYIFNILIFCLNSFRLSGGLIYFFLCSLRIDFIPTFIGFSRFIWLCTFISFELLIFIWKQITTGWTIYLTEKRFYPKLSYLEVDLENVED